MKTINVEEEKLTAANTNEEKITVKLIEETDETDYGKKRKKKEKASEKPEESKEQSNNIVDEKIILSDNIDLSEKDKRVILT